jgi:CxxC motif-containing protein (DUF1111 family)
MRAIVAAATLVCIAMLAALPGPRAAGDPAATVEAFASDAMVTNGFVDQATFDADFGQFSEDAHELTGDDAEGGLGPVFNGTSCAACHPSGNGSAQRELRAGHSNGVTFSAPPGGTLVHLLATDARCQQRPLPGFDDVIAERLTTTLRGLGYIEFVRDGDLTAIQAAQPPEMRGTLVVVDVPTGFNDDGSVKTVTRFGRFGHKCQHGSLLRFAADADRNEKGRTSILEPFKSTALDGRPLDQFVRSVGLDDPPTAAAPFGADIQAYAQFMRALPAPPPDFVLAATDDARAGGRLFGSIGCAVCHVPTLTTAPAGASINGFASVPPALGGRTFHPYTDLMTHRLGTGDGIVQGSAPADEMRTTPLWGLRRRTLLMHDGRSVTVTDAIRRHGGQAAPVRDRFFGLTDGERQKVLVFLLSL